MCSYWNKYYLVFFFFFYLSGGYYLVIDIKMDPNKLREININSCV